MPELARSVIVLLSDKLTILYILTVYRVTRPNKAARFRNIDWTDKWDSASNGQRWSGILCFRTVNRLCTSMQDNPTASRTMIIVRWVDGWCWSLECAARKFVQRLWRLYLRATLGNLASNHRCKGSVDACFKWKLDGRRTDRMINFYSHHTRHCNLGLWRTTGKIVKIFFI